MEKSAALKLIEKHRRHLHSRESDVVIARSAQRTYLNSGLMFVGIALIDLIDSAWSDKLTIYRISFVAVIFSFGALLCWQSYRYSRVRRLLTEQKIVSY
jgi:hypothetical protein